MTFRIHELRRARSDIQSIFSWIYERSPAGAASWLQSYDYLVEQLKQRANAFGPAHEINLLEFDVRQALFKTRHGRVYRALFFIEGQDVYILRVRGPGQAPVTPAEIDPKKGGA